MNMMLRKMSPLVQEPKKCKYVYFDHLLFQCDSVDYRFGPIYLPQYLTLNVFDVFLNKLILRVFLPDDGQLEVRHRTSGRVLRLFVGCFSAEVDVPELFLVLLEAPDPAPVVPSQVLAVCSGRFLLPVSVLT